MKPKAAAAAASVIPVTNTTKAMVGGCCVCSDERGWDENPLVYCDGPNCDVAVHQACYGIVTVPDGPWYCEKCASGERGGKVKCELCPAKRGALKHTDSDGWAHVVCALYIPEVRFGDVATMDPVVLSHVPGHRFERTCYLCERKRSDGATKAAQGAVMRCNKPNCKADFHVTCGQEYGLLCEEQGQSENIMYTGYCDSHIRKASKNGNIKLISSFKAPPRASRSRVNSNSSRNSTPTPHQHSSNSSPAATTPSSSTNNNCSINDLPPSTSAMTLNGPIHHSGTNGTLDAASPKPTPAASSLSNGPPITIVTTAYQRNTPNTNNIILVSGSGSVAVCSSGGGTAAMVPPSTAVPSSATVMNNGVIPDGRSFSRSNSRDLSLGSPKIEFSTTDAANQECSPALTGKNCRNNNNYVTGGSIPSSPKVSTLHSGIAVIAQPKCEQSLCNGVLPVGKSPGLHPSSPSRNAAVGHHGTRSKMEEPTLSNPPYCSNNSAMKASNQVYGFASGSGRDPLSTTTSTTINDWVGSPGISLNTPPSFPNMGRGDLPPNPTIAAGGSIVGGSPPNRTHPLGVVPVTTISSSENDGVCGDGKLRVAVVTTSGLSGDQTYTLLPGASLCSSAASSVVATDPGALMNFSTPAASSATPFGSGYHALSAAFVNISPSSAPLGSSCDNVTAIIGCSLSSAVQSSANTASGANYLAGGIGGSSGSGLPLYPLSSNPSWITNKPQSNATSANIYAAETATSLSAQNLVHSTDASFSTGPLSNLIPVSSSPEKNGVGPHCSSYPLSKSVSGSPLISLASPLPPISSSSASFPSCNQKSGANNYIANATPKGSSAVSSGPIPLSSFVCISPPSCSGGAVPASSLLPFSASATVAPLPPTIGFGPLGAPVGGADNPIPSTILPSFSAGGCTAASSLAVPQLGGGPSSTYSIVQTLTAVPPGSVCVGSNPVRFQSPTYVSSPVVSSTQSSSNSTNTGSRRSPTMRRLASAGVATAIYNERQLMGLAGDMPSSVAYNLHGNVVAAKRGRPPSHSIHPQSLNQMGTASAADTASLMDDLGRLAGSAGAGLPPPAKRSRKGNNSTGNSLNGSSLSGNGMPGGTILPTASIVGANVGANGPAVDAQTALGPLSSGRRSGMGGGNISSGGVVPLPNFSTDTSSVKNLMEQVGSVVSDTVNSLHSEREQQAAAQQQLTNAHQLAAQVAHHQQQQQQQAAAQRLVAQQQQQNAVLATAAAQAVALQQLQQQHQQQQQHEQLINAAALAQAQAAVAAAAASAGVTVAPSMMGFDLGTVAATSYDHSRNTTLLSGFGAPSGGLPPIALTSPKACGPGGPDIAGASNLHTPLPDASVLVESISGKRPNVSPITSNTGSLVGPPNPFSRLSTGSDAGELKNTSSTSASAAFPTSLEQLLERQWERGSQVLMDQAQNFDIASLLSCLHQLKAENQRLESQMGTLASRKDHLLAVTARLTLPLGGGTSQSPVITAGGASSSLTNQHSASLQHLANQQLLSPRNGGVGSTANGLVGYIAGLSNSGGMGGSAHQLANQAVLHGGGLGSVAAGMDLLHHGDHNSSGGSASTKSLRSPLYGSPTIITTLSPTTPGSVGSAPSATFQVQAGASVTNNPGRSSSAFTALGLPPPNPIAGGHALAMGAGLVEKQARQSEDQSPDRAAGNSAAAVQAMLTAAASLRSLPDVAALNAAAFPYFSQEQQQAILQELLQQQQHQQLSAVASTYQQQLASVVNNDPYGHALPPASSVGVNSYTPIMSSSSNVVGGVIGTLGVGGSNSSGRKSLNTSIGSNSSGGGGYQVGTSMVSPTPPPLPTGGPLGSHPISSGYTAINPVGIGQLGKS